MFKWNPNEHLLDAASGKTIADEMDENTIVYIHLSTDNHEPEIMDKDEATGSLHW